jgi:hypothetical protein
MEAIAFVGTYKTGRSRNSIWAAKGSDIIIFLLRIKE